MLKETFFSATFKMLNSHQKCDNVFFRKVANLQIKDHFQYLQNKHPKVFLDALFPKYELFSQFGNLEF